eukprot:TRINITY_DN756_c0_g1_i6.p1 TRINITY_DN756_c0_g1~~TRINITY_DN756_c0_g1_i6.p1  ORF type:complete len:350 (-),score=73.29 TRINITY_DN756_c0_g1_i6:163-1212(-)
MEHAINYMLLPGRVENWIVIVDFQDAGMLSVPKSMMEHIIYSFQNNYRGRLARMFILNTSMMVQALWMIAKGFLDPVTQTKVTLTSSPTCPELLELAHKDQLAKEYGGCAELPEKAWPPSFPKGRVRDDESDYVTEEELKRLVVGNPKVIPPPSLAKFARENAKGRKRGFIPKKTFYLKTRIERRDSFNGIVDEGKSEVSAKEIKEEPAKVETTKESLQRESTSKQSTSDKVNANSMQKVVTEKAPSDGIRQLNDERPIQAGKQDVSPPEEAKPLEDHIIEANGKQVDQSPSTNQKQGKCMREKAKEDSLSRAKTRFEDIVRSNTTSSLPKARSTRKPEKTEGCKCNII